MTPLVQKAVRFAPEPETALWFDVGQMQSTLEMKVPADFLMHLPSKRTGIVGLDTAGKDFALWLLKGEGSVTVGGCSMWHGKYFPPYAYMATDDGFKIYQKDKEITIDDVKPVHRMVLAVLVKINAQAQGYRATPKRTFLNQKRQAKGKSALTFDWHTIEIEPPKVKNDPKVAHTQVQEGIKSEGIGAPINRAQKDGSKSAGKAMQAKDLFLKIIN